MGNGIGSGVVGFGCGAGISGMSRKSAGDCQTATKPDLLESLRWSPIPVIFVRCAHPAHGRQRGHILIYLTKPHLEEFGEYRHLLPRRRCTKSGFAVSRTAVFFCEAFQTEAIASIRTENCAGSKAKGFI